MAITITLSPEQEQFVTSVLGDGRFASASEVVAEALLALESQEAERQEEEREFRAFLDRRMEEAEAGGGLRGEEVLARYKAKTAARRAGLG